MVYSRGKIIVIKVLKIVPKFVRPVLAMVGGGIYTSLECTEIFKFLVAFVLCYDKIMTKIKIKRITFL